MRMTETRDSRSGWGRVSVAGMSMLRVLVAVGVGVGWVERNNKASSGLQSRKYESLIRMKFGLFLGGFFDINQSPQPSIVALQKKTQMG